MNAVFYHIKMSGGPDPIDLAWALELFKEQMLTLKNSELLTYSNSFIIGLNGTEEDRAKLAPHIPLGSITWIHGPEGRSELTTMSGMQQWVKKHPDWNICYWHAKGLAHPHFENYIRWRHCMERAVITNWRRCVADIGNGCESVGAHWLDRTRFPRQHDEFFPKDWNCSGFMWGGNFWWAKASYLLTLPRLPANSSCRGEDFAAEVWIGSGQRHPRVIDYCPHFPTAPNCL